MLRLYRLDTDLWIDEIGSFQHAMSVTVGELFRTYSSPNQHLMNSLLERMSVAGFGEHDWAIRLPAVVFGIATVPAMYWLARPIMRGWESLAVAFLTAVSYHHIWFSQNARGYSGYLLFSVLATGALWRLVETRQRRWVVLYALSAMLALSSLVIAAFVIIAHVVLATILVVRRRRRGDPASALVRRLGTAFGITAVAAMAVYGPTAIQVLRVVGTAYVHEGTGFRATSLDFAKETLRGLAAGFGPLALVGAVAFAALATVGTVSLFRRAWLIVGTFVLALGMMAAVVVLEGWLTSPRFFLLVMPLAFLVVIHMLGLVTTRIAGLIPAPSTRRRLHAMMAAAAVAVCALGLALGLPRYYAVPKQPFRQAIATFSREAQPGDALVAVYQADRGFDYYIRRLRMVGQHQFYSARTLARLDSLGPVLAGRRVLLASTFDRAFKLEDPELWNHVQTGWTPVQRLPATVGYGEITFWVPKADAPNWAARVATVGGPGLLLQPERFDSRKVEESAGSVQRPESSRTRPPQGR